MNRCTTYRRQALRLTLLASLACTGAVAGLAAAFAQAPYGAAAISKAPRDFPPTALYGTVEIVDARQALINGRPYAIAPGMRLFDQHNRMLAYQQLSGQRMRVRYQMEANTALLQQVWLLRASEQPPRRYLSMAPPGNQQPDAVHSGPLGIGLSRSGSGLPATSGPTAQGFPTIEGQHGIRGIDINPR